MIEAMMAKKPPKRVRPEAVLIDFGPIARAALDRLRDREQARRPSCTASYAEIVRRLVLIADKNPKILD